MNTIAHWLLATHLDNYVATHDWVWPVCEIVHFFGMAALIGTVGAVDLRVLGIVKGFPIRALERFLPLGVIGFFLNITTGFIFVAGNPVGGPQEYLTNLSFLIKMTLIFIAFLNAVAFYALGIARRAEAVGLDGAAPLDAKIIAGLSLLIWFAVIMFGRLIMYNDTLLYTLGL